MRHPCSDARRLKAAGAPRHPPAKARRGLALGALAAFAAAVGLCFALPAARADIDISPRDLAIVRINVIDMLANEPQLPLPVKQRREALQAYYHDFGGDLLWLGTPRAGALVARLQAAESDGLDAKDYPGKQLAELNTASAATDKRRLAIVELYFAAAFLEYASDLRVGRFLPNKVDPNFFIQDRSIDQLAALKSLAQAGDLDRFFAGWQPGRPDYGALRAALADYRALAAKGGWSSVALGPALRPGEGDPRVPAIRARLALTDAAVAPAAPGDPVAYDDALVKAVERFQARQGLAADGVIGASTIVAMNVPVDDRINSIIVAMERLRWMPEDLGQQYLIVNIAGFELRRIDAGAIKERMAVVVGKPYHRTPVFSDRIRYVEFNPTWTVPPAIAVNEELPKLRSNPGAVAAQGFEAVQGDRAMPIQSIDWSRYGPGNFPFQLRQKPGANNALGRVKLMFPNPHNVYLHDSPARGLFSRTERAFSHGCIRLARPLELAEQVLQAGGVAGWDSGRIDGVIASAKTTVVNLREPLPVHITYLTAWVDGGTANFRGDIYGHDQKLLAALDGKAIAW
ncbi:MAG TPA: L,D-transpeptidase family protein [Pseudolabrys sp.]|jgi:murein L,D-transpeptidase YcbB/YkuD